MVIMVLLNIRPPYTLENKLHGRLFEESRWFRQNFSISEKFGLRCLDCWLTTCLHVNNFLQVKYIYRVFARKSGIKDCAKIDCEENCKKRQQLHF